MGIARIPGVGPLNSDIATAVAAPSAATIAAAVAAPSAATIAAAVAAPSAATIATAVSNSAAVSAQITAAVPSAATIAAAVGTSFNPTNMTLQQTITSSSNNISTGRNFVYALVIGGGGGGAPGCATISGAVGAGAGGYAFGLTPSTSVVTVGAGGVTGNFVNTANGTHNATNGGQSRYGSIIANGGGTSGKYIGFSTGEEGWAVYGAGGAQSLSQAGGSSIDWASIAWRSNNQQSPSIKGPMFKPDDYLGGEWGGDKVDNVNRSGGRTVNVGYVGGGAGCSQYSAGNSFAGYSSLRFAGGAGALGTSSACAGGGGGGGWLGAGGAANAAVTTTGGTGGNGGSGGGGGGGGGADSTGNTVRAGGSGGAGCVILYY